MRARNFCRRLPARTVVAARGESAVRMTALRPGDLSEFPGLLAAVLADKLDLAGTADGGSSTNVP
jgi:hypothetical protein